MKGIGTVIHPDTGEEVVVLDRRGLFRCKHRFMFRMIEKDEGSGFLMAANKGGAAHLARCQPGFIFAYRTDRPLRA